MLSLFALGMLTVSLYYSGSEVCSVTSLLSFSFPIVKKERKWSGKGKRVNAVASSSHGNGVLCTFQTNLVYHYLLFYYCSCSTNKNLVSDGNTFTGYDVMPHFSSGSNTSVLMKIDTLDCIK